MPSQMKDTVLAVRRSLAGFDNTLQAPDGTPVGGSGVLKNEALRLFSANTQVGTANSVFYTGAPSGGGYVDSMTTEIPTDADGFFVILANASQTNTLVVAGINYRVSGDLSARPYDAVTPVAGSFSGSAGVTIATGGATYATYTRSDTTYLSTVARTDNPTNANRRILHVRVAYTAIGGDITGTTPLTYWSRGGAGTRWTSNPTGFNTYTFLKAGALADNMTNQGNTNGGSTIFGIGYISRGKVRVIGVAGDSFVGGFEEGDEGRSFFVEGIIASAALTGVPTEYMSMGKGGVSATEYTQRALNVMALYKPTDYIQEAYSPNDGATTAGIDKARQQMLRTAVFCQQNGIRHWVSTGTPKTTNGTNTVSSYTTAQNQALMAWNADLQNYSNVIPVDKVAFGNGFLWKTGATADGTHFQESYTTTNVVPLVASVLADN